MPINTSSTLLAWFNYQSTAPPWPSKSQIHLVCAKQYKNDSYKLACMCVTGISSQAQLHVQLCASASSTLSTDLSDNNLTDLVYEQM